MQPPVHRWSASAAAVAGAALALWLPTASSQPAPLSTARKTFIPYADARSLVESTRQDLPAELTGKSAADVEGAWRGWLVQRDRAIRARVERGDEDSLVYLWHYGTSFTRWPSATERNLSRLGGPDAGARIVQQRLEDFVRGIVSPGTDERLQFARQVVERQHIDPLTPAGVAQARLYLESVRGRVLAEYDEHRRIMESAQLLAPATALAAYATMFRDRGLASDTSWRSAFAIEQALEQIEKQGLLTPGSVRRVAIVGPGLDFANKDDGYDFYPQQTIQPFALMDSLIRLGLARPEALAVTTLDVSPRVNAHIAAARDRAGAEGAYTLHLPLDGEEPWNPDLVAYWQRFGERIGTEVESLATPATAGVVRSRAVRIPAARVLSIVPRDVNIVVERLEPSAADDRFDLVVATNVLVYYDVFEQTLALVNVAQMLRPRGVFLSNTPVPPMPPMTLSARYATVVYSGRQRDQLFWYERQ